MGDTDESGKLLAVYDIRASAPVCPKCCNKMYRHGRFWLCQFLDCRLYDVPYRIVQTLARMVREPATETVTADRPLVEIPGTLRGE
jgi:hypothetical protein